MRKNSHGRILKCEFKEQHLSIVRNVSLALNILFCFLHEKKRKKKKRDSSTRNSNDFREIPSLAIQDYL